MTPEHTALAGLWIALIGAPAMAAAFTLIAARETRAMRWIAGGFAAFLITLATPLALIAPTITAQLL
jgi:hypothetical protein